MTSVKLINDFSVILIGSECFFFSIMQGATVSCGALKLYIHKKVSEQCLITTLYISEPSPPKLGGQVMAKA